MNGELPFARILACVALVGCLLLGAIVLSSAYLRLVTIGVGCTPWPQCYGEMRAREVSSVHAERSEANRLIGWVRIVHRVSALAAAVLAMLILFLTLHPGGRKSSNVWLASMIFALTIMFSVIGRFSAGSLVPAIGVANLMGGFAMMLLLWLIYLTNRTSPRMRGGDVEMAVVQWAALALLVAQIGLGVLVSVSYSAPVCPELFACGDAAVAEGNGRELALFTSIEVDAEGRVVPPLGAAGIQWLHRAAGTGLALLVLLIAARRIRSASTRRLGAGLFVAAVAVPSLGIVLALLEFPLLAALAHNGLAAALLLLLVTSITTRSVPRAGH